MTTFPSDRPTTPTEGVFISLLDIYREQRAHSQALSDVQRDVTGVKDDVTEVKDDVTELKKDVESIRSRQLPGWATALLGGIAMALVAAWAGVLIK
jgi:hypothetical protein